MKITRHRLLRQGFSISSMVRYIEKLGLLCKLTNLANAEVKLSFACLYQVEAQLVLYDLQVYGQ